MFPKIGTKPDLGMFGVPTLCEPSEKSNDDQPLCGCKRFVRTSLRTDESQGFSDLRGYISILANGSCGGRYLTDIHRVSGQYLGSYMTGGSKYKAGKDHKQNQRDIFVSFACQYAIPEFMTASFSLHYRYRCALRETVAANISKSADSLSARIVNSRSGRVQSSRIYASNIVSQLPKPRKCVFRIVTVSVIFELRGVRS
jgi:hypothetical protein